MAETRPVKANKASVALDLHNRLPEGGSASPRTRETRAQQFGR